MPNVKSKIIVIDAITFNLIKSIEFGGEYLDSIFVLTDYLYVSISYSIKKIKIH
jgi:hypothetical protein